MNTDVSIKRIPQLEGMRFIMCLIILFGHCSFLKESSFGSIYGKLGNASLPLGFFFVLSGFGIYYSSSYKDSLVDIIKPSRCFLYAIKRFKKIWLLYIIVLLLYAPFFVASHTSTIKDYIVYFLIDATLLQSLIPITSISHAICGPCWFLSALFVSYMFCPLFFSLVKKISRLRLYICFFVVLLVVIIANCISFVNYPCEVFGTTSTLDLGSTPYTNCWLLLLGMIIAKICLDNKYRFSDLSVYVVVLVTFAFHLIYNLIGGDNRIIVLLCLIDKVLLSLFVACLAFGEGKVVSFLSSSNMKSLGDISMYVYLFHHLVIKVVHSLRLLFFRNSQMDIIVYLEFFVVLGGSILVAFIIKYIIDRKNKAMTI